MRAALYARVSTEEQVEGWSLDAQLGAMRSFVGGKGWTVAVEYVDAGASGQTGKRPQFQAMLAAAKAREFDVVVCHRLDRFFRNLRQLLATLDQLREMGVSFVSVEENLDFTAAWGKVALVNLGIIAEIYVDNLRRETTKGKRQRAMSGRTNASVLPFGYCRDADGKAVVDESEAPAIRIAFGTYVAGNASDKEIAATLNAAGFRTRGVWGSRPWTKDTVNRVLQNPFYCGEVVYLGKRIPGGHEPIIARDEWEQAQTVRRKRRRNGRAVAKPFRAYRLSGVAFCSACKERLVFQTDAQGRAHVRDRSRERGLECPIRITNRRADGIHAQLDALIARLALPHDWRDRILQIANGRDDSEAIRRERARMEEKLRRLTRSYHDVEITEAEYRRERDRAQARLAELVVPQACDLSDAGEMLEHLGALWAEADEREKRAILGSLFARIYVNLDEGRITALEPAPAFAPWLAQALTPLDGGLLHPGHWQPLTLVPAKKSKYTGPLARAMQRLGRGEKYRDLAPDERAAYAEYRRERRDDTTRKKEREARKRRKAVHGICAE